MNDFIGTVFLMISIDFFFKENKAFCIPLVKTGKFPYNKKESTGRTLMFQRVLLWYCEKESRKPK